MILIPHQLSRHREVSSVWACPSGELPCVGQAPFQFAPSRHAGDPSCRAGLLFWISPQDALTQTAPHLKQELVIQSTEIGTTGCPKDDSNSNVPLFSAVV